MSDVFDKETRSRVMSLIRGKDTKPEVKTRKYFFSKGLRYRKNQKGLPGKPDIVSRKYKSVVFVNGCFWHGHEGCKRFSIPKTRTEFWENKIKRNKERDSRNHCDLESMGWRVFVVWECQVVKGNNFFLDDIHSKIISTDFQ